MKRKSIFRFLKVILILFLLLNILAFVHAYKFTHFSTSATTKSSYKLSTLEKLKLAFTGIDNPRPVNKSLPKHPFKVIEIKDDKRLVTWLIEKDSSRGTVILFHGYGGEKSSLLDKADVFYQLGYSTLLVDFRGSGGSEGYQTTIGFKEAKEVKACYDYLKNAGHKNIHVFGTSMGAVAIMKSMADYQIKPSSIIIECPFGTMYKTVAARFRMQGAPTFPMAGLLVFWGGVQNGFWAFSHNPEEYAKSINTPTLLLYGGNDPKVSKEETEIIYSNLRGEKKLVIYPRSGHENYLLKYKDQWTSDVENFLISQTK